jgi:hypothetical protein
MPEVRNQIRPEVLHKAVAGTNCEHPDELFEVELLSRTEHHCCILNELADLLAEFERAGWREWPHQWRSRVHKAQSHRMMQAFLFCTKQERQR